MEVPLAEPVYSWLLTSCQPPENAPGALAVNWPLAVTPLLGDPTLFLLMWFVGYAFLLFLWSIYYERRQLWLQKNYRPPKLVIIPVFRDRALGRRAWLRREGNPTAVFIADLEETGWQTGARVINRSQGGLRVLHRRAYQKGKILRVLSSHAPSQIWWVQVEVKNCLQTPHGWEMGCQFSDWLPWSVLLLFG
jgi:hypothetical protein